VSDGDLAIMRRIDELHVAVPVRGQPDAKLSTAGRTRRGRSRRRGTRSTPTCCVTLAVTQPNQVWATAITYVPMARGFAYLDADASVPEARTGIGRYLAFCNAVRPHFACTKRWCSLRIGTQLRRCFPEGAVLWI